jgi:ParB-like chromosome segregation protein Spo0J
MITESVPISDLTLLDDNPRKITKKQFDKLKSRIKRDPGFFQLRPCLATRRDGQVIVYAGHQRIKAAESLGWDRVPCIIEDDIDMDIQKERTLADNLHHGEFDWDMIANSFSDIDIRDLGFDEKTMAEIDGALQDDDQVLPESAELEESHITCCLEISYSSAITETDKSIDQIRKKYELWCKANLIPFSVKLSGMHVEV